MQAHRLVLGRINTDCVAIANAEAAAAMGARLDRVMRHDLAGALAQAVAPLLDDREGVLRLKYLRIRLDLGEGLELPGLATVIAEQIAAALKIHMAEAPATLKYWPDYASYLADYILMRLGVVAQPDWAFADLINLQHLPAERAAAELIRARPAILSVLAKAAVACGDAAAPVAFWPLEAKAALVRALVAAPLDMSDITSILPSLRHLLSMPLPAHSSLSAAQLLSEALVITLRLLAQHHGDQSVSARAVVFATIAVLAARLSDTPVSEHAAVKEAKESSSATDQSVIARVLEFVQADTQRRAALALLVRVPARQRVAKDQPTALHKGSADSAPVQGQLRSPRLGLALLMPSVLLLDAAAHLTQTQLAQVVWQTLDPADWDAAAEDPALQVLLPVKPLEINLHTPQTLPPERLLRMLAAPARKVYESSASDRRWSALLLADFASRLRGLHGSSHVYLRRQFLERTGEVQSSKEHITVLLDPIPLGILLHMAGFYGAVGQLPQAGRPKLMLSLGAST